MNMAKHEYVESLHLDKDPVVAISALRRLGNIEAKSAIRYLGYDPFYVMYWTNYQNLVYRMYTSTENSCIYIDATGKLVSKILKKDKTLGPHIFLYLIVINCSSGQYPVSQMLSECQDTPTIMN